MIRKFLLFVCVASLCFISGCGTSRNNTEHSPAFNSMMNQILIFNSALYNYEGAISKEYHALYYRSLKESWPSSKFELESYPYDEPYYSTHKNIGAAERACVTELVELQFIVQDNTIKSLVNEKPFYIESAVKSRVNKAYPKDDTPTLLMCKLALSSVKMMSANVFLDLAATRHAVEPDSLEKFLETKNASDLKFKLVSADELANMMLLRNSKEFRKKQLYTLINPRSFGH